MDFVLFDPHSTLSYMFIKLLRFNTLENLVILDIKEFDINLGMSWLYLYHAIVDYYTKTNTYSMLGMGKLEYEGTFKPTLVRIVSTIHT